MRGRRRLRTRVGRNECGVQLRLDRQLCNTEGDKSTWAPFVTSASRATKLTNGAEVEEEWQFPPAGQAGVGLAQLLEEGVRARLQRRQPGHGRVFQQSGAEGDGLRGGAGLKHLRGRSKQGQRSFSESRAASSALSEEQQWQLCSRLPHKEELLELAV